MVTIGTAPGVPRWPDLNGRHKLTDRVYDFLGNALGFFRAGLGLFEAGYSLCSDCVFEVGALRAGGRETEPLRR